MAKHIKIGVFIPNGCQFLDVACVDSLGVMLKTYLSAIPFLPPHVASLAPDVSIYYISSPEQGSDIPLTSGATLKATHLFTDEEVQPGRLDIVVVPGPDPKASFVEQGLAWLARQAERQDVDVLSGVTNGNELVAAYARASEHWPRPVVEIGLKLTEVGDQGQFYNDTVSGFYLGFGWQIVKGWFVNLIKMSGQTRARGKDA